MLTYLYTYLIALPIIFAFDMLWLGVIAKDFYRTSLAAYIATPFNWIPGIVFYLLFVAGVFVFAVYPGITSGSLGKTLLLAALFGFMCYMTYDLTNLATVRNWPLALSLVDMIWGTVLSTVGAYIMYTIYRFLA
jgi:uncharacterized membrane protein